MFHHVIVGIDGGPNGRDAITLGLQLVDPDGRISLAHVHAGELTAQRASNLDFDRSQRDESQALLTQARQQADIHADLLSMGCESVGKGLHLLAEEHDVDLLVVGSCHRGPAGRTLLGDNADATLSGTARPVAVAPVGYRRSARPLDSIGVAYDGSQPSRMALASARRLATREDAALRALHVLAPPTTPLMVQAPSMCASMMQTNLESARRALDLPADVLGDVVMGAVGAELQTFSGQVDLLVVGTRGLGAARRALLGSTSRHLAHHCRCPLLVVAVTTSSGDDALETVDAGVAILTAEG